VHSELSCPAHLPNLSACVYFLVGTSKWKCTPLDHRPSVTIRSQFRSKFQWCQKKMVRWALGNLRVRLELCVHNDGQNLIDVLLKTK
jgi:hypothetical protein